MTQSLHCWGWREGLEKNWHYHSLHWLEETLGHSLSPVGVGGRVWKKLALSQSTLAGGDTRTQAPLVGLGEGDLAQSRPEGLGGVGGKSIWKHLYLPKLQHHYTKVWFSMAYMVYGMAVKKHKGMLGYLQGSLQDISIEQLKPDFINSRNVTLKRNMDNQSYKFV